MLHGRLVFVRRSGSSAWTRQHSTWIPDIVIAVAARNVGTNRLQMRRRLVGSQPLTDAEKRRSNHSNATVAPCLLCHPFNNVVAVLPKPVVQIGNSARISRAAHAQVNGPIATRSQVGNRASECDACRRVMSVSITHEHACVLTVIHPLGQKHLRAKLHALPRGNEDL